MTEMLRAKYEMICNNISTLLMNGVSEDDPFIVEMKNYAKEIEKQLNNEN